MTAFITQRTALLAAVCSLGILAVQETTLAQGCGQRTARVEEKVEKVTPQSTCPVMGGKIDKALYADVDGYRLYVCCQGCIATIKADPSKYIAAVRAKGETPEAVPKAVSAKCGQGQAKGTEAQCPKKADTSGACGQAKQASCTGK